MKIATDLNTARTFRKSALGGVLFLCCALHIAPCRADDAPERSLLNDAKLYVSAPLRWQTGQWMQFAGTVFALGVAHEFDKSTRHAFEPAAGQPLDSQDPNSTRDALPAAA